MAIGWGRKIYLIKVGDVETKSGQWKTFAEWESSQVVRHLAWVTENILLGWCWVEREDGTVEEEVRTYYTPHF